jgi:predicted CopG family antitoxin
MYKQDTKAIRVSIQTYKDLKELGSMADTFDSVIKELLTSYKKGEPRNDS